MTAVERYHSGLFVKNTSNSAIILLAQICPIHLFITLAFNPLVLSPCFFTRLKICLGYNAKLGSQKIAAASGIASTIQIVILFNSSCCHDLLNFTTWGYWQPTKLRSTSSPEHSLANGQQSRSNTFVNNCFIPGLDEKKTGKKTGEGRLMLMDGSSSRGVETNSFNEDAFFTLWFYLINIYLSKFVYAKTTRAQTTKRMRRM